MMNGACAACLVVFSFLWMLSPAGGDAEVSCVFMESCILPCSFQGSTDAVIHWIHETAGNTPVHSYYNNRDQLGHQGQRFRGRTSLFKDQISGGNASLQLTGVQVQDQGRYKCYTSTIRGNKESFINLQVDAPVHKVDMEQEENRITCSSEGIYPEPELTWSTRPPSNVALKNPTRVQQTEQQLYNIYSSLILSDRVTDLVYSCTVSTRRNKRRATLRELRSQTGVTGVIVGLGVGAILVAVLAAGVLYCKCKKRGERRPTWSYKTFLWCLQKDETSEGQNEERQSVEEANV